MRSIINKLKNLYRWGPTIWQDRHDDDRYMYRIMSTKFKLMSECVGPKPNFGFGEDHVRSGKALVEAYEITNRLFKDQYNKEYWDSLSDFIRDNGEAPKFSFVEGWEEEERLRKKDKARLLDIIDKYSDDWWTVDCNGE